MSIDATNWAWNAPVQSSAQRLTLLSLADRAGENHVCFPSVERLHEDTKLNRKTILKVLSELQELGFIEDTGHRKGATGKVVVYRLLGVVGRENQYKKEAEIDDLNSTKNGTVPKTDGNSPNFTY